MYSTTQHLHHPVEATRRRAHRHAEPATDQRAASMPQAMTLYVVGILVETLGLALIAAYGWILAGAVIAVAGLWMAIAGHRRWPGSEQSVSNTVQLTEYLAARLRSQ